MAAGIWRAVTLVRENIVQGAIGGLPCPSRSRRQDDARLPDHEAEVLPVREPIGSFVMANRSDSHAI